MRKVCGVLLVVEEGGDKKKPYAQKRSKKHTKTQDSI